jgi:hypothetical protein
MKFITKFLPALLLSALATSASATVVDYSMTVSSTYAASGQFAGTDSNADGFLSFNELSAFTFDLPLANYHFDLSVLSDFGRYQIAQNQWLHDGAGWGQSNFAYASFYNGGLSVNTTNASNVVTQAAAPANDVPEPAPMALLGLGLLAIGAARRARK